MQIHYYLIRREIFEQKVKNVWFKNNSVAVHLNVYNRFQF
jgi:hypothetical protein